MHILAATFLRADHQVAGLLNTSSIHGCFHELGVLLVGILVTRALLFGVYVAARGLKVPSDPCLQDLPRKVVWVQGCSGYCIGVMQDVPERAMRGSGFQDQ